MKNKVSGGWWIIVIGVALFGIFVAPLFFAVWYPQSTHNPAVVNTNVVTAAVNATTVVEVGPVEVVITPRVGDLVSLANQIGGSAPVGAKYAGYGDALMKGFKIIGDAPPLSPVVVTAVDYDVAVGMIERGEGRNANFREFLSVGLDNPKGLAGKEVLTLGGWKEWPDESKTYPCLSFRSNGVQSLSFAGGKIRGGGEYLFAVTKTR